MQIVKEKKVCLRKTEVYQKEATADLGLDGDKQLEGAKGGDDFWVEKQIKKLNKGQYERECSMSITPALLLSSKTPQGDNTLSTKTLAHYLKEPPGPRNECKAAAGSTLEENGGNRFSKYQNIPKV